MEIKFCALSIALLLHFPSLPSPIPKSAFCNCSYCRESWIKLRCNFSSSLFYFPSIWYSQDTLLNRSVVCDEEIYIRKAKCGRLERQRQKQRQSKRKIEENKAIFVLFSSLNIKNISKEANWVFLKCTIYWNVILLDKIVYFIKKYWLMLFHARNFPPFILISFNL